MPSTPAKVILTYLASVGVGTVGGPSASGAGWFLYRNREPKTPDQVVTVYNTGGRTEGGSVGRRGQPVVNHPTISFRIRSIVWDDGWEKGREIVTKMAALQNTLVLVPGDPTRWTVQGFLPDPSLVTFVMEDEPKRQIFTLSGQVTLRGEAP